MNRYGEISKIELFHNSVNINIKPELEKALKFNENEWFIHSISHSSGVIVFDNTGNVYIIAIDNFSMKVSDYFNIDYKLLFDHTKSELLYVNKTLSMYKLNQEFIDLIKKISNEFSIKIIMNLIYTSLKSADLKEEKLCITKDLNLKLAEKDEIISTLIQEKKELENAIKFIKLNLEYKNEMISLLKDIIFRSK